MRFAVEQNGETLPAFVIRHQGQVYAYLNRCAHVGGELSELVVRERTAIEEEVADIAILLCYLCHDLNVELDVAVRSKLGKNRQKYPVSLARGTATKYDRL